MIHTLEFEVEYDFKVIGLSCHSRDYRMAWLINSHLGLEFSREEELKIMQKNGSSEHSYYTCTLDDSRIHLCLMRNRSENGYFMPEIPQFDFLLKIQDAEGEEFDALLKEIRSIQQVIYTMEINPEKYKSGVNLLF